jgi:hypothetical protein
MNKPIDQSLKPITIFLCITLALSAIFYFLIIYSGTLGGGGGQYVIGVMWCPGISALITMKILKEIFLTWDGNGKKLNIKFGVISYPYFTLIAYLAIWIFGWEGFTMKFVNTLTESFGLGPVGSGLVAFYVILLGIFGTIRRQVLWVKKLVGEVFGA